jgi:hypothetical protein
MLQKLHLLAMGQAESQGLLATNQRKMLHQHQQLQLLGDDILNMIDPLGNLFEILT